MPAVIVGGAIEGNDLYVTNSSITATISFKNTGETKDFYICLWYWDGDPLGYGQWKLLNYKHVTVSPGQTLTDSISGSIPRYGTTSIHVSVNDYYTGNWLAGITGWWVRI
jgi:hypothetical protein